MKKFLSIVLLIALVATGFTNVSTPASAAALNGKVVFSGSTSVNPLLQALGEAFMKKNPGVKIVEQNVTGSGSGISDAKNLNSGVDFGMSSRKLTSDEANELDKFQICLDGLAVVVNKSNPIKGISSAGLYKIYTKSSSATNWNQIKGSYSSSVKVAPFGREAGSGTRSCFEDFFKADYGVVLPSGYDAALDGSLASTGVMQTTVQKNKGAIGYMSFGDMDESKVKALMVDGIEPSKYTVADGSYPIKRPFLLVYNKKKTLSPEAKAFVEFVKSSDGQSIISKMGFVKNDLVRVKAQKISLNKTSITLKPGATAGLSATVTPSNTTDKAVTFTTSNKKVATVNNYGLVKAVGVGTAVITVKTKDGSNVVRKCTVKVINPVSSVKLNKSSASVKVGKTLTLKATVNPSKATDKSVTWKSTNTKIATVTSKGVVKGKKAGTVTITAITKEGAKKATCKVKVVK